MGALPPHPRSLALVGNREGQEKRRAELKSPAPPSSPAPALGLLSSRALSSGRTKTLYFILKSLTLDKN